MKITETSGVSGSGKPKKPKKTGDSGAFDAMLDAASSADGSSASQAAESATGIEATAFLAMQEVSDEQTNRHQTLKQGCWRFRVWRFLRLGAGRYRR